MHLTYLTKQINSFSLSTCWNSFSIKEGRIQDFVQEGVANTLTTTTRMLWEFSFLFRFLFPHENSKTIGTN
jgi:hypothetical protein